MRPTNSILGQHFTIARQLRFTLPRMLMSLFIMSYMVADGVLISRYMGTVALASLNVNNPRLKVAGFATITFVMSH